MMVKQFRAGAARIDITPPAGLPIAGWCFGKAKGVLDRLYAACLVLDDGSSKTVIISTDLIGIEDKYVRKVRARIQREFAIKKGSILISASHTHSGPTALKFRGAFGGEVDPDWINTLQEKLVSVVGTASSRMFVAAVGVGKGVRNGLTYNRRSKNGPVDGEVGVIRVDDLKGNTRVLLVNFTCHPVALHGYKDLVSSDFIAYVRGSIEKVKGNKVTVLYTTGAAGNINPLGFKGTGQGTIVLARKTGDPLGKKVLEIAGKIKPSTRLVLKVKTRKVEIPLARLPSIRELRKGIEHSKDMAEKETCFSMREYYEMTIDWAKEAIGVREKGKVQKTMPIDLQAIRIGEAVFLAIPAEVFVEIGLDIKKSSPFRNTFIVELGNGVIGYIPTKKYFKRPMHEVVQAPKRYGLFSIAPETAQIVKVAGLDLIGSLKEKS